MRLRLKLYPFHAFLFIPFIVLFLFAHNLDQTKAYMTYRTLWVGGLLTLALYLLLNLFFKNRLKAGVLVTCLLFALFQYGVVYEFFESLYYSGRWPLKNIHRYLIALYLITFSASVWLVKKSKHDFIKVNYFLNAFIIILLGYNSLIIALGNYPKNEFKTLNESNKIDSILFDSKKPKPDIYYIILDGYASNTVLSDFFEFDNLEFNYFLKQRKFRFCSEAFANYYYTSGSLGATLNFSYIDTSQSSSNLIRDNKLFRVLHQNNYRICHLKSGYAVTSFFKLADQTIQIEGPNEFEKSLFKYTILRLDDLIGVFAHKRLISQFEKMEKLVTTENSPKFNFLHFVAPHPPYIFDRNGNMRTKHQFAEHSWEPKEYYIDQLIYVNKQIQKLVSKIIDVNPKSVIIIQSDHGPWITAPTKEEVFKARSQILYAYYAPYSLQIPNKTSSVNTFRYLLNSLFNCKLDTLPDNAAGKASLMLDAILTKKASQSD